MPVRINRLGDSEIKTALAHHFQITKETFILGHIKTYEISCCIIDRTMNRIFNGTAEPLVRGSIDLDELTWVRFAFPSVSTMANFLF